MRNAPTHPCHVHHTNPYFSPYTQACAVHFGVPFVQETLYIGVTAWAAAALFYPAIWKRCVCTYAADMHPTLKSHASGGKHLLARSDEKGASW